MRTLSAAALVGCGVGALTALAAAIYRRRRTIILPRIELQTLAAADVPPELRIDHYIDLTAADARLQRNPMVTHIRTNCVTVVDVLDSLHAVIVAFMDSVQRQVEDAGLDSGYHITHHLGSVIIQSSDAHIASSAVLDASAGSIFIGTGVTIEPAAYVKGPAVIRHGCTVRHGAYIRGDVYLGAQCVVGGELKHMLAFDEVELPHYGYVGDSVLGYRAHFGCGALTANLPLFEGSQPAVEIRGTTYVLGRRKFGAIVGDHVQLGCGTVTEPGCLLAPHAMCYPLTRLPRGYYAPRTLLKNRPQVERAMLRE